MAAAAPAKPAAAAAADSKAAPAAAAAPAKAAPVPLTGLKKDMDEVLTALYKLSEQYNGDLKERNARMMECVKRVDALCEAAEKDPAKLAAEGISAARLAFWRGRAYDSFATYQETAEKLLQQAVKKEPAMVEAWNALGNCFWKKKEFAKARDCLNAALQQNPKDKDALCSLSMVLRNMPVPSGDAKLIAQNIKDSVQRAKDALAVDGKDGKCWYVLGNALLTQFFMARSGMDVLQQCLKAYKQAEVSDVNSAAANPDLHFNRATVFKFYEDYQEAVDGFAKAAALDPQMPAADETEGITRFVTKVAKLVASRGGLKPKKLTALVADLAVDAKAQPTATIDGAAKKRVALADCRTGHNGAAFNAGTILVTKVIAPVSRDTDVPASFLVADAAGAVCVVSLYNATASVLDAVKTGATLAVIEPTVKVVALKTLSAAEQQYKCVHTDPRNFIVDGRRLNASAMAGATIKTSDPTLPAHK